MYRNFFSLEIRAVITEILFYSLKTYFFLFNWETWYFFAIKLCNAFILKNLNKNNRGKKEKMSFSFIEIFNKFLKKIFFFWFFPWGSICSSIRKSVSLNQNAFLEILHRFDRFVTLSLSLSTYIFMCIHIIKKYIKMCGLIRTFILPKGE